MSAAPSTDEPLVVHVDVTDTVATHWRAGIQRVVAQLVHELSGDARLRVVPVVWLESVRGFRTLTDGEAERLAPYAAGSPAPVRGTSELPDAGSGGVRAAAQRLRPLLGRARRALVAVLTVLRVEPVLRGARRWVLARTRDRSLVPLRVELAAGDVLLEMDTVWNNTWVDRSELYARLRSRGVRLAVVVYDLLPQQHPEWFEDSLVAVSDRTIAAQAAHAEVVMAISADTATAFARFAAQHDLHPPGAHVIALGANAAGAPRTSDGSASDASSAEPAVSDVSMPRELAGASYVLTVGTVEPRKNHATLLDVFDRLVLEHPDVHLVVVGRPGWHNDEVIDRLSTHPELGVRLHWYRSADDALLGLLYDHARVVAVASITEGYGLPVIEAMSHGVPVVSSDGGALVEAGGELVERVAALDVDAWVATLGRYLRDDELVAERRVELARVEVPQWSDTGVQVAEVLLGELR